MLVDLEKAILAAILWNILLLTHFRQAHVILI